MTAIEHAAHAHGPLAHQFEDLDQQRTSATLGMWTFLATEVMFFGGLFAGFAVYRFTDPRGVRPGLPAARHLGWHDQHLRPADQQPDDGPGRPRRPGRATRSNKCATCSLTMLLATTFLGIKAFEYYKEYEHHLVPGLNFSTEAPGDPGGATPHVIKQTELFFVFYFFMTGLHATHMVIGIGVMAWMAILARRGRFTREYYTPLELTGLYWHFVDMVWVFLFPLLYLIELHK